MKQRLTHPLDRTHCSHQPWSAIGPNNSENTKKKGGPDPL